MHFFTERATNCVIGRAGIRQMATTVCTVSFRAGRFAIAPVALLAIALPLGGCSFDLGSWGPGNDKPPPIEQKPTGTVSGQGISEAQGYAARGQALARSGKADEALAEFERALALDPYNVQALYGRGLIHQGEKKHQQAIEDFSAANGLKPQQIEPLLARANSTSRSTRRRKPLPISTRRSRPTRTTRQPGRPAASPMSASATRPGHPLPTAARLRFVPGTKPREAASRGPAAS